ncbi:BTAD domain-containing putative transcriptional regulator [Actinomadura sp. 7K507]|uniref:ATP-binding protein n=1 Tax=Actinomadura sp. 7K507 TaxID=2530365 RepID=UPI00104A940C|nr:BTAD domain-containing putative transcriptional regulator [Actinomadura sp. 7K507]TDC82612.1 AfsR/SARP family transcriptional regulator [Actinomadura sp. 7K507]
MSVELTLLSGVACRGRDVTSPRLRSLLALLAGEPRAGVSVTRLVEGVWPDDRPENPAKALQVVVSRARSQFGADVIASTPAGYRLGLDESEVDASAVLLAASASARCSRDGDHRGALAHAEAGLALWDGPPELDDGDDPLPAPDDPLSALRAERASAYRTLARARALALARLARHAEAFDALTAAAREHPRDEEILAWLLRCEAATAGPSAALGRYESYRRSLRDELGTDPGAALLAVQEELLRDEAPAVRRGVAHEPNPLLGRAEDIAAVRDLLRTSRVTSIVGTGGLGKTRLANAVARDAPQRAVHLVALAGVARNEDVAAEVASVLGVGDPRRAAPGHLGGAADRLGGIVEALGPGPVLLVLDNCEHVVDGVADLAGGLVSMTRDLRVLTTGRAPLGLSSESVYPLPALDPPTAAELFRQRARAARPNADVPADAVEQLCRHLDGLPLAVELAAARVRVMSVPEITRGLDDRFALLRGNVRDAPSRHRTMHAVVEWSWNLLAPSGRAAMRSLSIFSSGFTAAAARHLLEGDALNDDVLNHDVLNHDALDHDALDHDALDHDALDHDVLDHDVLEILDDLVGQSLLEMTEGDGVARHGTRFRMLESVREFSAAHREAEGETDRAVSGLLAWAREFGATHHETLFGHEPLARVRVEQDNLLQALRHGLARGDTAAVAATAAVLGGMWLLESAYDRLVVMAEETAGPLSRFRPGPDDVETARAALTVNTLASLLFKGPQPTRTLVALRRLPPASPTSVIRTLAILMAAGPEILDPDGGAAVLDRLCASDEPLLAAFANCAAGYIRERDGDLTGALAATEAMLATSGEPHTPWLGLLAHSRLGELLMQLDESERAAGHLHVALDMLGHHGWSDMFGLLWALAAADLSLGDTDRAERWLDQSLVSGPDEAFGTATFNLGARAEIAFGRGDTETGLRLWRQAVERLAHDEKPMSAPGLDPWTLEAHCVTVVAHARHGRLDLVEDLATGLPGKLSVLLAMPETTMPAFFMDLPFYGGLLLALTLADLARAGGPAGAPPDVRARAARTIALAERLHFVRNFQPTMSSPTARRDAEEADAAAYSDAVSEYAAMDGCELRNAARELARHLGA